MAHLVPDACIIVESTRSIGHRRSPHHNSGTILPDAGRLSSVLVRSLSFIVAISLFFFFFFFQRGAFHQESGDVYVCPWINDSTIYVRNVYPPLYSMPLRLLGVVVIFLLCCIVGLVGNAICLTILRHVMLERTKRQLPAKRDYAILYIGALSVSDFLMALSLPPAIIDSILGFWIFGTSICKLHHILGSISRIYATFVIATMSFDRYVAVCHPQQQSRLRSRRFVLTAIVVLAALSFLLLLPMLVYVSAKESVSHELWTPTNVTRIRSFKCVDSMPPNVFLYFSWTSFTVGYLIPFVAICIFNWRVLHRLYSHTRVLPRSGIPLRRIVVYTLLLAVAHFICWGPFWCTVLYQIYLNAAANDESSKSNGSSNSMLLFSMYIVHLLPYVGAATNWLLYGLLNTQMQARRCGSTAAPSHGGGGGGGGCGSGNAVTGGGTLLAAVASQNVGMDEGGQAMTPDEGTSLVTFNNHCTGSHNNHLADSGSSKMHTAAAHYHHHHHHHHHHQHHGHAVLTTTNNKGQLSAAAAAATAR